MHRLSLGVYKSSFPSKLQNTICRTSNVVSSNRECTRKLSNTNTKSEKDVTIPEEADIVVIGGGSIGCSTLYHLTKLGMRNVVLLEKDKITSGTTWHTAGLLWRLRPNDVETEIQAHTRHLLRNVLEKETGIDPGWIENGGLFIASSKERMDEYKRLYSLGKAYDIESQVLSPTETKKLYPLMNVSDLYATLLSPGDGTLDPTGWCTSLTKAATKAGAKLLENCPVTGIQVVEDHFGVKRISGIETKGQLIKTKCIINCTGVWAPMIGKMADVQVPLIAMKHAYVVTDPIDGIMNMPNVRDHDSSIYLRVQGSSLCIGGYEPNPIFIEKVEKDFAFSLYDLNWDVFGSHINSACNRVPILGKTGIKSTVCGPESFTPDHKPIMGEDIVVRGFFHGCGFNSAGMMLSGGCGQELAKWVIDGRPDLDMYGYDIRRFSPKVCKNHKWLKERSHESYARHYVISYPHDDPLAGRNMRLDPFHQVLLDAGCVYQEKLGWERPGWFSPSNTAELLPYDYYGYYDIPLNENYEYRMRLNDDYTFDFPKNHDIIKKECLNCRENAALFNMSYFGKYYITGPDAKKAVDWIFSNDVAKQPGITVYTCMLNYKGRVEADLTVSPVQPGDGDPCDPKFIGDGYYVASGGGAAQHNLSHIISVIQDNKFNVEILDHSEDMGLLSIQGPKSREILQSLTDADFSDQAFPFSTHKIIKVGGHKVRALRLSFVGELGWELHIPASSCVPVYKLLMEAGRKHGLVNSGYRAIDSLSIEKGYRHWHADLRMDDTPLEAGLAFTCKLKQTTPFLGREAVENQKAKGLKKRIACFTIDEHRPLWGLEAIFRDGVAVGFLRRADYGFAIGRSLGYGYVRHPKGEVVTVDYLKSGSYELESMGQRIPATIHLRSPFDPNNKRVKGIYEDPLPIHQSQ